MTEPLGARLRALADLVPAGPCVADIGTDHALLPAWLVREGRVDRALGVDRAAAALASARPNVEGLAVSLRLADGLAGLRQDHVHAVVIAGMGAPRMVGILARGVPATVERLVLQPTEAAPVLRRWLVAEGWDCVSGRLVEERGHAWFTEAWERGGGTWSEADLAFGREVRRSSGPALRRWLVSERSRLVRVEEGLARARRVDTDKRAQVRAARARVDAELARLISPGGA